LSISSQAKHIDEKSAESVRTSASMVDRGRDLA
jgi:hypothetical protein